MVRLRPVRSVRILTFEEKTRVANLFMLLIEVNQQKSVTQKRRSPKSAKSKAAKSESQKLQPSSNTSADRPKQIHAERTPLCSPRVRKAQSRPTNSRRDLFLKPFARIFNCSKIIFILGIHCNDRHHNINSC